MYFVVDKCQIFKPRKQCEKITLYWKSYIKLIEENQAKVNHELCSVTIGKKIYFRHCQPIFYSHNNMTLLFPGLFSTIKGTRNVI